jgi:hypothetical protein
MRPLRALFSSPAAKKILHERAAFLFQHALSHFDAMIQKICVADPEASVDRAGAFVCRPVNQTPDARLDQSARAHGARLNRRVNINARQPVVAELTGGFAKRDDFSVSSWVAVGSGAISRYGDELVLTDNTSADRHLTAIFCLTGRGQRLPHPAFINLGFRGSFH